MRKGRFGYGELGIGVLFGALLGLGIGLLVAPQSGRKTRADITTRAQELKETAQELMEQAQKSVNKVVARLEEAMGLEEKGARKKISRLKEELKKYNLESA